MSTPTASNDAYLGRGRSVSQLLYAAKWKLQRAVFSGRISTTVNQAEVDAIERDALKVLCLVRSVRNSFAPINRIPPEILSLIPTYYGGDGKEDEDGRDEGLIASTHVCRLWRDVFTSCPSLWTRPDFRNIEKTRTYIQRSQSSPLEIHLGYCKISEDAFTLVIPHIRRLKSLSINADGLPSVLRHFRRHAPLLEKLDVKIPELTAFDHLNDDALFNGNLTSLRELRLKNVITRLPWKNLANLQVVNLCYFQNFEAARMLDFLESAPLLHTFSLSYLTSHTSNAPIERIVTLRCLRHLQVSSMSPGHEPYSNLLRHLHIPAVASLTSEFHFDGDGSPLLDYLPERSRKFNNLAHVTTVNLRFDSTLKFTLLKGPYGSLRVLAKWENWLDLPSPTLDHGIFHSLGPSILSTTRKLTISDYKHPWSGRVQGCPVFQALSSMNNLRTLTLIDCNDLPFVLALDPGQNQSGRVSCPKMVELVLYLKSRDQFYIGRFIDMVKNRALRGARLSSVTIVSLPGLALGNAVFNLRQHVAHVVCGVSDELPHWDEVPGEGDGKSW